MTNPPDFKRRTIVKALAASSLIPLLGSNLIGCSNSSNNSNSGDGVGSIPADFNHGVASGDPLTDRVILWTRVTPAEDGEVVVAWQIAADADFADIVAQGDGVTTADVDYTVKVDAEGLQPGTAYYYRFMAGDNTSPTGKTRTLPSGAVAAASFAVVSCSNYPAGFFNVYGELAKQDLDAVLHLGDYLYEYSATGYASDRAEELGRVVEPANEIISLSDYRTRYAQYRGDTDLQATMDDIIYRRFQYGDLLDLLMLDTRHVGRNEQLQYSDFATGGIIDVDSARAAATDSNRTIMGSDQLGWLRGQLTDSTARWQVLGQQVLMSRYHIPSPMLEALDPGISPVLDLGKGTAALLAAVDAKGKAPEDRTEEEQALLDSAIPYNLDAWDGYSAERDEILEFAQQMGSRLIALAGDTHNAWTSQLRTSDGKIAGVEFGCTSVSSPGFDGPDLLGPANAGLFGPLVTGLIDDLVYANLAGRGYLHLAFSADDVTATHRFITTVDSREYAVNEAATKSFVVNRADLLVS